jgi:hypothetical protein
MTTRTWSTGTRSIRPAVLATAAKKGPLPGEEANLAKELRPAVRRDDRLAGLAAALDDLGFTGQEHDQVIGHVTVSEQHIPGGYVVLAPVPAQHLKLRRVQDRAAPCLTLLRGSAAAPGSRARRRSSSVSALRPACPLLHHVPATSCSRQPPVRTAQPPRGADLLAARVSVLPQIRWSRSRRSTSW